eukprot:7869501-Alexandrium_andersonii.AAC.1
MWQFAVDAIVGALPKAFVLENVPQLATHAGGAHFRQTMATLERAGYPLERGTLDAHRHGGLPQDRPRLFVLG